MAVGRCVTCQLERLRATLRDQDLESLLLGRRHHEPRIMRIVLDDEHDAVALAQGIAVIQNLLDLPVRARGPMPPAPT